MDLSDRGICPARMASICISVCLYLYLLVFSFYCICLWICLIGAFARHEWHPWRELLPGELSATDFAVVFASICICICIGAIRTFVGQGWQCGVSSPLGVVRVYHWLWRGGANKLNFVENWKCWLWTCFLFSYVLICVIGLLQILVRWKPRVKIQLWVL